MDYIQPCRKYKYFTATSSGEMATVHKYEYDSVVKDLAFSRKGWPDKDWQIFRLVFVQDTLRKKYFFSHVDIQVEKYWQQYLLPEHLVAKINDLYPDKALDLTRKPGRRRT